jgi:hypothetical protein
MNDSPGRKSRRLRLRFRLPAFFLFVAILAVPLGWLAGRMRAAQAQRAAISELAKLEYAFVYYECYDKAECGLGHAELSGPAWLRRILGDDFFNPVTRVNLGATTADDHTLTHLTAFPKLQTLLLEDRPITDGGIARLRGMTELEFLTLSGTQITDEGLAYLELLTQLKVLWLCKTGVTDKGLVHLTRLPRLEALFLCVTNVGDGGIVHLKACRNLRWLALTNTKVTDAGVADLAGCTNLEELYLCDTQVSSEAIEKLRQALPRCSIER